MKYSLIFSLVIVAVFLSHRTNAQNVRSEHYLSTAQNLRLLDDGDFFWTDTWAGTVRFKKSDHSYKMFPGVRGFLARNPKGIVWHYGDSTVSTFNGSSWDATVFHDDTSYAPGTFYGHDSDWITPVAYITALAFDSKGSTWAMGVSTFDRWSLFHKQDTGWARVTVPQFPVSFTKEAMLIDRNDDIWITGEETPPGPDYSRYGYSVVARIHDTLITLWKQEDNIPPQTSSSIFYGLALDSGNHVWVSRYNGASTFDGTVWKSFPRSTQVLQSGGIQIDVGRNGIVWFSYFGVSSYSKEGWSFATPPLYTNAIRAGHFGGEWVATNNGMYRHAQGAWKQFGLADGLPDTVCNDVIADAQGDVIVATQHGAARYDGNVWSVYIIPNQPAGNQGGMLAVDRSDALWVAGIGDNGAITAAVERFDGSRWEQWNAPDPLPSQAATGIAIDSRGATWVTLDSGGFASFDGLRWNTVSLFDTAAPRRHYLAIAADSSGGIWASTLTKHLIAPVPPSYFVDNQELLLWKNGTWSYFGPKSIRDPASFSANSLAVSPDQTVWATGAQAEHYNLFYGGLYKYDSTSWKTIDLEDKAANQKFIVGNVLHAARDNSVWISYQNPISDNKGKFLGSTVHYDGKIWNHYGGSRKILPGYHTNCFAEDRAGNILAGSEQGISIFDGSSWTLKYGLDVLGSGAMSMALASDGSLWVSTQQNGIVHFDNPSNSVPAARTETQNLAVYPNPIHGGLLHISIPSIGSRCELHIYNMAGEEIGPNFFAISSGTSNTVDLEVSSLSAGAYILQISGIGKTSFVKQ